MSEDEATVVPFENRVVMSVGTEQRTPSIHCHRNKAGSSINRRMGKSYGGILNRKYHRNSAEYVEAAILQ